MACETPCAPCGSEKDCWRDTDPHRDEKAWLDQQIERRTA